MADERVCLTAITTAGAVPDEEHWVLEYVDYRGWQDACRAFGVYVEERGHRVAELHAGTEDWVRRYAERYARA